MQRSIFSSLGFLILLLIGNTFLRPAPGQEFDQLLKDMEGDQPPVVQPVAEIHGVVVSQKKYSISVQSGELRFDIKLPSTVPIERELVRPKIDLSQSSVQMTLPCTGEGGNQALNQKIKLPLTETTFLLARFRTPQDRDSFLSGETSTVNDYCLFPSPSKIDSPNHLQGRLQQVGNDFQLEMDGKSVPVKLGNRSNRLGGFSILDLRPGSEISVKAIETENGWVAQRISFQQSKPDNTATAEDNSNPLPRILSLGDMVSFSYQRALHQQFDGKYRVFHPPTTCGGSSNWPMLNRWLGDYSSQQWDVILFNTGMHDNRLSKQKYQQNLRRWIEAIQPAGRKIVWLTTTPIQGTPPNGSQDELVGKVPGRMNLQNQWASEVLQEYPSIETCDLWQIVKDGEKSDFKEWWADQRPQFNFRQAKKLAEAIANTIEKP